ncbi:MAG: helix-turn-helix domain-containing protein, partial [Actinomycetota bacterium]
IGRTVYVLLPTADPNRPERLPGLARDIVARARESIGIGLRAGVGSIVNHVRDVPRSRGEADMVLRALASSTPSEDVADLSSALDRIALYELSDFVEDRPHLRSRRLERLRVADEREGSAYIETLRAFLDAFGDIPRAADALNVHPNTFRYRLKRLVEIGELNLDDPDQRLLLSLELRLNP